MVSHTVMSRARFQLVCGACFALAGVAVLLRPELLANRFMTVGSDDAAFRQATLSLSTSVALVLIFFGCVPLVMAKTPPATQRWAPVTATVFAFLALVQPLSHWMIDDAGITFAYSENLVRGDGLRLHPNLPPEEGYSNSLWMLWLAGLRAFGIPIPWAAKWSCIAVGVATCVMVHVVARRLDESVEAEGNAPPRSRLLLSSILFGAPFLVWSVSGLEHGLQGLAILLASAMPALTARYVLPTALALLALVWVRPEAPLIVIGCFATHVLLRRKELGLRGAIIEHFPIAAIPGAGWAALMTFRVAYFGDPMPNPYYVKAGDATFIRVLNLVGGGWDYVLTWAYGSAMLVLLPVIAMALVRSRIPTVVALGFVHLAAQTSFVVYANGDWMGCWRFVSPMLPTLAVLGSWTYAALERDLARDQGQPSRVWLHAPVVVACLLLSVSSAKQYLAFLVDPTTPFTKVGNIGKQFVKLGHQLGVENPILAHHDAGGTSYTARIQLLDLGGLGNRAIAKHMQDREFLTHYILDEVAPDFVFGVANNFAAGSSLFWQTPTFAANYLPVEFPNDAQMQSDLCHMKRSLLQRSPLPSNVHLVHSGDSIVKVVVD